MIRMNDLHEFVELAGNWIGLAVWRATGAVLQTGNFVETFPCPAPIPSQCC